MPIASDTASPTGPIPAAPSPTVTFAKITFSDGTTIGLEPEDIIVLVGPNNAGKSVALRELYDYIGGSQAKTVIKNVTLRKTGTADALRDFLRRYRHRDHGLQYLGFGFNVVEENIKNFWENDLRQFKELFCKFLFTEARLTLSNPTNSIAVLDQAPHHPIHLLYVDDQLERRISSYFRRAFGKDLVLHQA